MIIEYSSANYPESLKYLKKPPSRLYVKGNIDLLKKYGIAVIGSRTNTLYGEKMCKKFTKELVEFEFNIISGLAKGIDSIAHTTALKNSGSTIAVLPCGLENIYPKENIKLANEIVQNGGLLISEYEDNVKADSKKFIERNRIVAGLGLGTLVIEAGERSGTSITARMTFELEKPVFSVPSSLENIKGKTTNELIKKGAQITTNINDILECFDIKFSKRKVDKKDIYLDIPQELINVFETITNEPITIDEISRKTNLPISEVSYKTMMLEIEDKIVQIGGRGYIRKEE